MDGIKGAVALAMQAEWKLHASHLEHLTIFTQPTFVRVEKAFKPQELVLVGASMRFEKKAAYSRYLASAEWDRHNYSLVTISTTLQP